MNTTFGLLKFAQKTDHANHSVVVGDFNFNSTWKAEEEVITSNGFKDVMHDFVPPKAFTMHRSKRFGAWRPDKVVMEKDTEAKKYWKCTHAKILGDKATDEFAGDDPAQVARDGIIRTPSDHFAIVATLTYFDERKSQWHLDKLN